MADKVGVYQVDYSGENPRNRIDSEIVRIQGVDWRDYHFFIPEFAPYFGGTLTITLLGTGGRELIQGQDYVQSHLFLEASQAVGRGVFGSITFFNKSLSGVFQLAYQTLGGEWTTTTRIIQQVLTDTATNPRITTWEQVVDTPRTFPVVDHEWHLDDMVGQKEIVAELQGIEAVLMEMRDQQGEQHAARTDNPHRVTKTQVGLELVENLPVATQVAAEQGKSNDSYTTPLRVAQAIKVLALDVFNQHLNNLNNPHQVTKAQTGLGNVDNLATATREIAELAESNRHFMTPLATRFLFEVFSKVYADHLEDQSNPHRVTPGQIGAATPADIDNALQNFAGGEIKASDADKFGGQTPAEWQAAFLNTDSLLPLVYTHTDVFQQASGRSDTLSVPDLSQTSS